MIESSSSPGASLASEMCGTDGCSSSDGNLTGAHAGLLSSAADVQTATAQATSSERYSLFTLLPIATDSRSEGLLVMASE